MQITQFFPSPAASQSPKSCMYCAPIDQRISKIQGRGGNMNAWINVCALHLQLALHKAIYYLLR